MKTLLGLIGTFLFSVTITLTALGSCVTPPAGLVAWWPAEGDANDSANLNAGTNNGTLSFAPGESGMAFSFNGSNSLVGVQTSPNLNVGAGGGLAIEAWINPADVSQAHPILQWTDLSGSLPSFGVSFWISIGPTNGGTGPGCLLIDLKDSGSKHRIACSAPGLISGLAWQHVAATYDKSSGMAALYLNGSQILQTNLGNISPYTATGLWIGHEQYLVSNDRFYNINKGQGQAWFAGLIDELSIYNRALSDTEIQSIFAASSSGKCPVAPTSATIQPASQTVAEGGTATYTPVTSGSPPLSFQWAFGGTNLPGATNSSLVLTNIQLPAAGNYFVYVSNSIGSFSNASATLTVLSAYAPTWAQTTAPTNLSWTGIASSTDGKKIVAVSYEGYIYTSNDAGKTWVSNNVPKLIWYGVTSSADGNQLAAAAEGSAITGGIYISTNSGSTWRQTGSGNHSFIAGSRDGSKLISDVAGDQSHIYISTNAGLSWATLNAPGFFLGHYACSADGNSIIGADIHFGLYVSSDAGLTWRHTDAPTTNFWFALTMSADGRNMIAGAIYDNTISSSNSFIYSSSNSGTNWSVTGLARKRWQTIACSDDGTKLVAGTFPGFLYTSIDSGTNWTVTRAPSANWSHVASSADGTQLVAGQYPGSIFIYRPTALDIGMADGNLTISWPTNVPGFILQQSTDVTSANWFNVPATPIITNSQYLVILPISEGGGLFRLMYP